MLSVECAIRCGDFFCGKPPIPCHLHIHRHVGVDAQAERRKGVVPALAARRAVRPERRQPANVLHAVHHQPQRRAAGLCDAPRGVQVAGLQRRVRHEDVADAAAVPPEPS